MFLQRIFLKNSNFVSFMQVIVNTFKFLPQKVIYQQIILPINNFLILRLKTKKSFEFGQRSLNLVPVLSVTLTYLNQKNLG